MKKLLEPFYRLFTRSVIMSIDKAVLERAWKNDYQPYGYKVIKRPHMGKNIFGNEIYKMVVCRTLLK